MAEITVIVPVYRVEQYLVRCVDSILSQTFRDFELILVDDGSPDRSGEMCEEYAKRDSRITVLHRENGGLSAARNTGLDWMYANSSSEYVTFIDSDDWVHPRYLEALLAAAERTGAAVSVGGYVRMQEYGMPELPAEVAPEALTPEQLLTEHTWNFNYAWCKLYRREFFREVRYPEGKNFEDVFTTYRVLFAGGSIAFVDVPLYCYYVNNAGITRSPWKPGELVIFEAMKEQMAFYREKGFARALEKEEYLYVNHFAYQICRIRENREDLKKNLPTLRRLRREMMALVRQNPERFGYRKMPQCYEAAYPKTMHIYHAAGAWIRRCLRH